MNIDRTLEHLVTRSQGNAKLHQALHSAPTDVHYFETCVRYIDHYASMFAGCLFILVGRIALAPHLFRDPRAAGQLLAPRAEVVSHIHFAGIDEMEDRGLETPVPHRTLAQATIAGIATQLDLRIEEFDTLFPTPEIANVLREIQRAYGVFEVSDDLLRMAVGVHFISETLARGEYLALVASMKKRKLWNKALAEVCGAKYSVTYYPRIHTKVEEEHAAASLDAVHMAIEYSDDPARTEELIVQGAGLFVRLHDVHMSLL